MKDFLLKIFLEYEFAYSDQKIITTLYKKWSFPFKDFFSKCDQICSLVCRCVVLIFQFVYTGNDKKRLPFCLQNIGSFSFMFYMNNGKFVFFSNNVLE